MLVIQKTVAVVPVERKFAILPEELNATIEMKDEVRQRGIYNATVYNANVKLKGYFSAKDFPEDKKVTRLCIYWFNRYKSSYKNQ